MNCTQHSGPKRMTHSVIKSHQRNRLPWKMSSSASKLHALFVFSLTFISFYLQILTIVPFNITQIIICSDLWFMNMIILNWIIWLIIYIFIYIHICVCVTCLLSFLSCLFLCQFVPFIIFVSGQFSLKSVNNGEAMAVFGVCFERKYWCYSQF